MSKHAFTVLWILTLLLGLGACGGDQPVVVDDSLPALRLESGAFEAEGTIPQLYTCDGSDVSLPLNWSEPPAGTQSLALIFDDEDAPVRTWVHWVLFNVPAGVRSLPEGVPAEPAVTGLGEHGSNSWGNFGYGGPCPPKGGTHRYTFRLYALDTTLDLEAGASRAELDRAMEGHILGVGQLVGRYGR